MFSRFRIAAVAAGIAGSAAFAVFASTHVSLPATATVANGANAPDFKGIDNWFNSAPLDLKQLRGKVVLVEFWTFDCINCAHTLPYVKDLHARYRDKGLVVVGVHSPEYGFERDTGNLRKAIVRNGIEYPVAQDNEFATWRAYGNRYWPAFYLIDQNGKLVYSHFGEGQYAQTEEKIRALLARDDKAK
ncbi:thioredoxin family protein [Caballeronia sp. LZ001]|uniref:thioredoxin family protein n=1 Tax=Caballeronia sp. LZ001 TaxID=3038553 RepID=UPI002856E1DF|nr:thioredoxin family protein [Caballeronia sp. LZ001]MDR5806263.1 thioredoxin family protein [Caballeronia sp. LZ001]